MVLSARPITDSAEIGKIKRYDYYYVNYRTLFDTIKKNLGTYAIDADQSYLAFLFDFIRTIENRYTTNNMELKRFFYENQNTKRRSTFAILFYINRTKIRKDGMCQLL